MTKIMFMFYLLVVLWSKENVFPEIVHSLLNLTLTLVHFFFLDLWMDRDSINSNTLLQSYPIVK